MVNVVTAVDVLAPENVRKLVIDCVNTELGELEDIFDDESIDETDAVSTEVTVLEIDEHEDTVAETEMLRDCNELNETKGLRDSTDADEDEDILREAIEERDSNGEVVDETDESNEILRRDDIDVDGELVFRKEIEGLDDDLNDIVACVDLDGEFVEAVVKLEEREGTVDTDAKVV